jgi:hypothetical protein
MPTSRDEIRQVLERAAQLERSADLTPADVDVLMQAADEVGIPRAAIERALRERQAAAPPPEIGQLVLAPSTDAMKYAAEVTERVGDAFKVRFLRGGERVVGAEELHSCSFLPGDRIQVKWPGWGNWTCTVVSYDAANQRVTVSDGWGETGTYHIADVWVNTRKAAVGPGRARLRAALLGAAAAGAAIGSIITAILLG